MLVRVPNGNHYLGGDELTLDEIRRLPTDPDELRAWLDRRIQPPNGTPVEGRLVGLAARLLTETPAAPPARAAAFRMLAELPGVRNEGRRATNWAGAESACASSWTATGSRCSWTWPEPAS